MRYLKHSFIFIIFFIFSLSCIQGDKSKENRGWCYYGYNPERTFHYPFASKPVKNFTLVKKLFLPEFVGMGLFSGDVDGDGFLELVSIGNYKCHVFKFYNGFSTDESRTFDCLANARFLKDINSDGSEEIITSEASIDRFEIQFQDGSGKILKKISRECKDISKMFPEFMIDRKIFGYIARNDGIGCRGAFCLDFDSEMMDWFYTIGPYIKRISLINKNPGYFSLTFDTNAPNNGKFGFGRNPYLDTITTDAKVYTAILTQNGDEELIKQHDHRGHCLNVSAGDKIFALIYKPLPHHPGEYFIKIIDKKTKEVILTKEGPVGTEAYTGNHEPVLAKLNKKWKGNHRIVFSYPEAGVVSIFDINDMKEKRVSIPDRPFIFAINDIDGDGDEEIFILSMYSLHVLSSDLNEELSIPIDSQTFTGIISDLNNDGYNEVIISTMKGILILSTSENDD